MQVLHVCSELFPLLKTGGLADVLGALPAAQIADGVDTRVLLPAFPDIRRGIPDAQVVTRRDTFAGRITLLFGHYNGVGIYLIDAPICTNARGARITTPTSMRTPTTCCALRYWVGLGAKWPAGWIRSGVLISSMPTTGMPGLHPRISRRAATRRNRCSQCITWPIRDSFMPIT